MKIDNKKYYNVEILEKQLKNSVDLNLDELLQQISQFNINITDEIARDYANSKGIYYDEYNLIYFERYTSILKSKLEKILKIMEYILSNKSESELNEMLNKLNIRVISVNGVKEICGEDINRLVRFVALNFINLKEKYEKANDLKTYEKSEIDLHALFKDGFFEWEIYPKKDLQSDYYINDDTFLDLSNHQKKMLLAKKIDNLNNW